MWATFGAIAEYTRDAAEPAELNQARDRISGRYEQGRASYHTPPRLRLIASESAVVAALSK